VTVSVRDPAGFLVTEVDALTGRIEPEVVRFVAEAPGIYNIAVRALESFPGAPQPSLEIDEIRRATFQDRWVAAEEASLARLDKGFSDQDPDALQAALPAYQGALERARRLGDLPRQAGLVYRLGVTHNRRGEVAAARDDFAAALDLYRRAGNPKGIAATLNQLGRVERRLGDVAAAVRDLTESLRLWQGLGAEGEAADVGNNLGFLEQSTGRYDEALEAYDRALQIYRKRQNLARQASVLNNIGGIYDGRGEPEQSLLYYREALPLSRSLKNRSLESELLNNFGAAYVRQGKLQEALDSYVSALELMRSLKAENRESQVLTNLADLFIRLGSPEKARELFARALALQKKSPDRQSEAAILGNLGRVSTLLGQFAEAEDFLNQALELAIRTGDRSSQTLTLVQKAELLGALSRPDEARVSLHQGLSLARQLGDHAAELVALGALGRFEAARGETEPARRDLEAARRLAQELGIVGEEAKAHQELARLERSQGHLDAARGHVETALARFESLRSDVAGDQSRTSLFATQREAYDLDVDILEQLHLDTQAFEAAERARARGLLDFLGQAQVDVREGDPQLLAEEGRLRAEINAKAALRAELLRKSDGAAQAGALTRELTALSAEHQIAEARLQARSARYARLTQPDTRLSELQATLDGNTVVLEYFLGEPHSYLWKVSASSFASFELPGRERIESLARRVHEQLGSLGTREGARNRQDLEELSRTLLGPVLDGLQSERLAIVADGALLYVPFAALLIPAEDAARTQVPLVVAHEVVHLPSAAVLREIRRARQEKPRPAGAVAVLADPVFGKDDPRAHQAMAKTPPAHPTGEGLADLLGPLRQSQAGDGYSRLTWSGREAELVAAAARGRDVLIARGFQASRELAISPDLGRFRILHFATHGFLDAQHPELSGLVFSQLDPQGRSRDGFLRLQDVYHLHLNADLVVLSGCETALGKNLRGEGIVGLTHGFFHAGASQVLASLWPVRDRATAELMQRFYHGLFHDGLPASAALRQAQISLWKERTWRDPYFWAAFILQGDWQAGERWTKAQGAMSKPVPP